jgi:2-haloacid dehalogenase
VVARALLFDVFGTCVDWRTTVTRAGEALGRRLSLQAIDWASLADAWRARYQPQLETVRSGARPWTTLDVLHREALDQVLADFGLDHAVPESERDELTLVWHRLDPWPDTVEGLRRLKRRYIIAPVSNGHIALIVNRAKHADLPWDAVLGAELARAYKPQPAAYLASVAALGLHPHQAMMVAAHNADLEAAKALGLQTAFVSRPHEHGPDQTTDLEPEPDYDQVATDLIDLAQRLGA